MFTGPSPQNTRNWTPHARKNALAAIRAALGVYGSKVNVGPLFFTAIQTVLTNDKLRAVVARIRNWVESDGRYRP